MTGFNTNKIISVLIVDDSPSVQQLLRHILESDPSIRVQGFASNGREALEMISSNPPDIITMDMSMPEMDGEEATRIIMETHPIPIVVITASLAARDVKNSYRALEAGALAVIRKPVGVGHDEHKQIAREIIRHIKILADLKLIKRRPRSAQARHDSSSDTAVISGKTGEADQSIRHVAIGASTGGPPVIQQILKSLPQNFNATIYLVQHISAGFQAGFIDWLSSTTQHPVLLPGNGTDPQPGQVYMAPTGMDMGISRQGRIQLLNPKNPSSICPSVSHLFLSMAENVARSSMGVLLTGMGKDGAAELRLLRDAGGITVAQDRDSSVIFGMPGEALKLNAARHILAPDKISALMVSLICKELKLR